MMMPAADTPERSTLPTTKTRGRSSTRSQLNSAETKKSTGMMMKTISK